MYMVWSLVQWVLPIYFVTSIIEGRQSCCLLEIFPDYSDLGESWKLKVGGNFIGHEVDQSHTPTSQLRLN